MSGPLYQKMAVLFGIFSSVVLAWNVITPENPDHLLNVIEQSAIVVLSALSYFMPQRAGEALQVIMLAVIAFIPFGIIGSPFFGACVAVIAIALLWAYDGFRSRPWWKFFASNAALLYLCVVASAQFSRPGFDHIGRAVNWVFFINVFCFVAWLIVEERIARSVAEIKRMVEQNRQRITNIEKRGHNADGS